MSPRLLGLRSLSDLGFRIHSEWISRTILVRREPRIEIRGDRRAGIGPKDARRDRKSFGRKTRAVALGAQGLSAIRRSPTFWLRRGWEIHVRFGLEYPELSSVMCGDFSVRKDSPALRVAKEGLKGVFDRLAQGGLLRLSQDEAMLTAFSSDSGAVLALQFLAPTVKVDFFLTSARERVIQAVMIQESRG